MADAAGCPLESWCDIHLSHWLIVVSLYICKHPPSPKLWICLEFVYCIYLGDGDFFVGQEVEPSISTFGREDALSQNVFDKVCAAWERKLQICYNLNDIVIM